MTADPVAPWRPDLRPAEAVRADVLEGRLLRAATAACLARPHPPGHRARALGWQGLALALLGHAEQADATQAEATQLADGCGEAGASVLVRSAEAAFWGGLPRRAIGRAERALALTDEPEDVALASLAAAWAQVELGREPDRRISASVMRLVPAAGPELRGAGCLARGEHSAAAAALDEAARRWAGRNATRELLCRWAAGEARRRAGRMAAAIRELRATLDVAAAMGCEPVEVRARRSLRLAGYRPVVATLRRPPGSVLTGRERQVLDLVASGRTNAEIARRMGIGRPTATRLLSNTMLKLGADRRAQAVVLGGPIAGPRDGGEGRSGAAPDLDSDGRAILAILAEGRTLGTAAARLGLSRRTADRRLLAARAALGVENTVAAVAAAARFGLLAPAAGV